MAKPNTTVSIRIDEHLLKVLMDEGVMYFFNENPSFQDVFVPSKKFMIERAILYYCKRTK